MGGIPRQAEALAVVGDEFDSHDDLILLMVNDEKASARIACRGREMTDTCSVHLHITG